MSKLRCPCKLYQSSYLAVGVLRGHDGSGLSGSSFAVRLVDRSRRPSTLACDRTLFDLPALVCNESSCGVMLDFGRKTTSSLKRGEPGIGEDVILGESGIICRGELIVA
jgi:hypothetical protein